MSRPPPRGPRRPAGREEPELVLLLADPDDGHRARVVPWLAAVPAQRRGARGRARRFRIVEARDGAEALRRSTDELDVVAVDLVLPRVPGLDVVQALRARDPDLAILAFTAAVAPASEAVAAVMAGADHFLEWRGGGAEEELERAIELALERRRLARAIERGQAEIESARARLTQLSGELTRFTASAPGASARDVLPFEEAARRYLAASARLFEGDAAGLAARLGVSYYALRRLLARYRVPFPRRRPGGPRPRRRGDRAGPTRDRAAGDAER